MKITTLAASILILGQALCVQAESLSSSEAKLLSERTGLIAKAFDSNDVDTIVEMTHPSLFVLMGGKEKMRETTKTVMNQLRTLDLKVLESKLGQPGELHAAGDDVVCFYPRTTVVKIGDKKIRSIGFLICIRPAKGGPWLFLDGSALKKNPELLKILLPALPDGVPLPENRAEPIE